jgi:hypothetical protein
MRGHTLLTVAFCYLGGRRTTQIATHVDGKEGEKQGKSGQRAEAQRLAEAATNPYCVLGYAAAPKGSRDFL